MNGRAGAAVAWLLASVYYFYQYSLRSSPAVMLPQLSGAFALDALGVASLVGLFYYGYSPFSLIAGAAIDRFGPKAVVPIGALMAGAGALLFGTGNLAAAQIGRFLQGAGGVFALVGAVYIASKSFPPSRAATLIGATQMFGMAGGSAGQFVVGPIIAGGLVWTSFWTGMGALGIALGILLLFLLPKRTLVEESQRGNDWMKTSILAMGAVFRNPQSILCGLIAGLLFIPTTIFDMIWGIRYLQDARGIDYASAVMRSAAVPFGWIIGCPLLGWISDKMGRRKPVILGGGVVLLACLTWILYGAPGVLPPYTLALVAGVASGAAMLPYTVIKEANPPQYSGTATGVVNFLNFTFSALLGPVFGLILKTVSGGSPAVSLEHFQTTFAPLLLGVVLAMVLTFFLNETGAAAQNRIEMSAQAK
jgi:MFS family permease